MEVGALFDALTAGLPTDGAELDGEQRARQLLAHLLEFHRREDKSTWWEFFHRCGFTEEEHFESRATIGALAYNGAVEDVKKSVVHRYHFPGQTHEIAIGDSPKNPRHRGVRRAQAGVLRDGGRHRRDGPHHRSEEGAQLAGSSSPRRLFRSTSSTARCCRRVSPGSRMESCRAASRTADDGWPSTCCAGCRRASGHRTVTLASGDRPGGGEERKPRSDEPHRRQADPPPIRLRLGDSGSQRTAVRPRQTDPPPIRLRQTLETEPHRTNAADLVADGETPPDAVRRIAPLGSTARCSPCRDRPAAARRTPEPG